MSERRTCAVIAAASGSNLEHDCGVSSLTGRPVRDFAAACHLVFTTGVHRGIYRPIPVAGGSLVPWRPGELILERFHLRYSALQSGVRWALFVLNEANVTLKQIG